MSRLNSINLSSTSKTQSAKNLAAVWLRISDFLQLAKMPIVLMEMLAVAITFYIASPRLIFTGLLFHAALGTALVAASASALNQLFERDSDRKMLRTANRPLPTGRLSTEEVIVFAALCLLIGVVELAFFVNWTTASLGVLSWFIYAFIYTPMKTRSSNNTAVGAVSGAIPVLMGWTATGAAFDPRAFGLLAVLFLWQFPHFMAIAWIYRKQYAQAGHQMLPVTDPTGLRAGALAVVAALALLPMSLLPIFAPETGSLGIYCLWSLLLGVSQLAIAVWFWKARNETAARWLLRASLIYLPMWLGLLALVQV